MAGVWDGPDPAKCFSALGDDCETCWRIGYEREKARADAAEASLIKFRDDLIGHVNEKLEARAALAAARRECEGLKTALRDLLVACTSNPGASATADAVNHARALAAAAGEEGQ